MCTPLCHRSLGQVRAGVGRLVAACEAPPLVLPIMHAGMERVMPRGSSLPVPGQEVRHTPATYDVLSVSSEHDVRDRSQRQLCKV